VQGVAGQPITASIVDAIGTIGDQGRTLGARIEVPVTRAIASAWRPATLVGATWTVTVDGPLVVGDYLFVWRTDDAEPPFFETFLPLMVISTMDAAAATGNDYPDPDVAQITPEVDDVAQLLRTRTVTEGGYEAPEQITFDETTRPTGDEVEVMINNAVLGVRLQLPDSWDPQHNDQVRHLVALYTAMLVEGSYFREQVDESGVSLWRDLFTAGIASLKARMDADRTQFNLPGRMEPLPPLVESSYPWTR
jgi:hypothetical protein